MDGDTSEPKGCGHVSEPTTRAIFADAEAPKNLAFDERLRRDRPGDMSAESASLIGSCPPVGCQRY